MLNMSQTFISDVHQFKAKKSYHALIYCDSCVVQLDVYCNFSSQKNANVKK